ncbi:MAG: septum formation initiator family protein [Candidatus Berkelbacteria bacterium]|nr:septum formation initiator family protein [Candidatus Berkelbacteria bacterium]
MKEIGFLKRMRENLPDRFWRFLIIGFMIYSFIIVGKVLYDNRQENKTIDGQIAEVANLRQEVEDLQSQIAYEKTETFREKVARAKLRYALPGETVVAVPYDSTAETSTTKSDASPAKINRPNYEYWKMYFFGS